MGTKNNTKYFDWTLPYQDLPASGPQNTVAVRTGLITLKQTRSGADDPMYKTKIARGVSATNTLTGIRQSIVYRKGLLQSKRINNQPNKGMVAKNYWCGLSPSKIADGQKVSPTLVDKARNRAAIGIRNKIQSVEDSYSGLQFLGELREALKMIKRPAASLFDLTEKFGHKAKKTRQKVGRKHFADAIAGSWLEYAFGAQPLFNDIVAIAESLLPRIDQDQIIRLSYTCMEETAVSSRIGSGAGGVTVDLKYSQEEKQQAQVTYVVGYRKAVNVSNNAIWNLVDQGGFRFDQVVPTAWELLPWSFFIDYFSNIGDCISSSLVRLDRVAWVRETVRTTRSREVHSGSYFLPLPDQIVVEQFKSPYLYASTSEVNRSAANIPFGTVRFELPGHRSQLFNIGALATLQFTKFLK